MGHPASDLKYRFQWSFPIVISPHDPTVIYAGANVMFKSTDEGQSWTPISGDLTRNDKAHQQPAGGPLALDVPPGDWRNLTLLEVAKLKSAASGQKVASPPSPQIALRAPKPLHVSRAKRPAQSSKRVRVPKAHAARPKRG